MPHPPERDWMIVAPWWKWRDVRDANSGRVSRPVFQKYDTGDLINTFLKKPQRSLKFVTEDLVHHVQDLPPTMLGIRGKPRRFSEKAYLPDGTNTRKIFRDTHRRFYLVVCQMHCDGPGFPRVAREKVCEAGFVIRRRTSRPPTESVREGTDIIQKLTTTRRQLARVETELIAADSGGRSGLGILDTARTNVMLQQKTSVQALIGAEQARFRDWTSRFGIVPEAQGWIEAADGRDGVGAWQNVPEMPETPGLESTFPMYPLIPPKNDPHHAGSFGTIYFGVLPTATAETTLRGEDRFDDQTYYEVRCFVKRHKTAHDAGSPCHCPDRYFWSVPSEPYKIAPHFDLTGTSKRPVTIQLPDINELAAQAKPMLGVAFQKPPGYPMVGGTPASPVAAPSSPSFQICSFPIVLITIVASFVFEIFLPVVMLVFQLWWMLAFKFCIPPEISLAAGVDAEFALDASLSAEFGIEADIDASIDVNFPAATEAATNAELKNNWAPIAVGNMQVQLAKASTPAGSPTVSADLEWESEVAFQ